MTATLVHALSLSLLLLVQAGTPARGAGDPPEEETIVIEGDHDPDFDFDFDHDFDTDFDGDRPMVVQVGDHWGRGYLGVHLLRMTPELREHFGAPRDAGVLVSKVAADSPAAKAGVQVGDIITAADGERIGSTRDLSREVRRRKEGDTVKLEISRNRAKKELTVKVAERKRHEINVGDLKRRVRDRVRVLDLDRPLLEGRKDLGRLRERLEELEKRLGEIEKKLR
jgi:membrane-associated protease RseP (regulator of RpoE activity)